MLLFKPARKPRQKSLQRRQVNKPGWQVHKERCTYYSAYGTVVLPDVELAKIQQEKPKR